MTAQDIDLGPFTAEDSKTLREKIDTLGLQPSAKVCLSTIPF
jgi:hypothetical protein